MTIAYVAQTRDHLLMLDEEGVCLHVHRRNEAAADSSEGAMNCLGAQYVAALDPSVPGFLGHKPTLGVPMLFAKVGPSGKIRMVRTGPLERFDEEGCDDCDRATEPRLGDTQRTSSPSIRYLNRPRFEDEEEPTLRFQAAVPTRRSAPPPPPPMLTAVRSAAASASSTRRARVA